MVIVSQFFSANDCEKKKLDLSKVKGEWKIKKQVSGGNMETGKGEGK